MNLNFNMAYGLREAGQADVMQTEVEFFPYDDANLWKLSMGHMLDFLFQNKYPRRVQSLRQQDYPSTVIRSHLVDLAYNTTFMNKQMMSDVHDTVEEKQTRFVHVTKNLISPEIRENFKTGLKEDKVLGPILATFRRLIFGYT